MAKDPIVCSNCGAPFHGLTTCQRTVDGNDPLFVAIADAGYKVVDLIDLARSRNQPGLALEADKVYAAVLALTDTVNVYAQPKEKS